MPTLPFKLNQNRRRHIPRQQHKVANWPAYDASLRRRGSLTVWFSDEAIEAWAAAPREIADRIWEAADRGLWWPSANDAHERPAEVVPWG